MSELQGKENHKNNPDFSRLFCGSDMVEMAGTAPACKKVSFLHLLFIAQFDILENRKWAKSSREKRFLYELFATISHKGKGKTCKYDMILQVLNHEICSRPSGTQFRRKDYTVERLGSNRAHCRCKSTSKTSERRCFCIYIFPFDNGARRPKTAHKTTRVSLSNTVSSPNMLKTTE